MEQDQNRLASLFPDAAVQLRAALSNLHLAAVQLAPAEAREHDPALDQKAALLDQSYYRLLRLVNSMSSAAWLANSDPLPLQDRDIVGLAVYQLLSNAFKFTPAGGSVTVELRVKNYQVLLSVADTGQGIPEERLSTLFDRYLHGSRPDAPSHGLGLGLPLCRRAAEGHGGTLMAESRVGEGSRFTLSLPDRRVGGGVSDIPFDYAGGFNRTLMNLADALPVRAFLRSNQD